MISCFSDTNQIQMINSVYNQNDSMFNKTEWQSNCNQTIKILNWKNSVMKFVGHGVFLVFTLSEKKPLETFDN